MEASPDASMDACMDASMGTSRRRVEDIGTLRLDNLFRCGTAAPVYMFAAWPGHERVASGERDSAPTKNYQIIQNALRPPKIKMLKCGDV